MRKVFGVAAAVLALGQLANAQEIGIVSVKPDLKTGEMLAELPARPEGEAVYVIRDGKMIASGRIKNSKDPDKTVVEFSKVESKRVQLNDRISLSSRLTEMLPLSAYKPAVEPTALAPAPATAAKGPDGAVVERELAQASAEEVISAQRITTRKTTVRTSIPEKGSTGMSFPEKGGSITNQVTEQKIIPASPRLTPRDSALTVYPAPAVEARPSGGILGPYGPGLAAAAPVGTPYLRSPAFAGPPVIYMPQTVTRVLLPGVTPYPSNIMHPPAKYVYASAPFTRTDIYVDLPYGTFYWPQGYAGTAPVEPQVPAYVLAPSTAVVSNQASYSTQRYDPAVAHPETLNPVGPGETEQLGIVPAPAPTPMPDGGPAPMSTITDLETAPAVLPGPTPIPQSAEITPAPLPELVIPGAPAALPDLNSAPAPAPGALPGGLPTLDSLSAPSAAPAPANPFTSDAAATGGASPNANAEGIVIDDAAPGAVTMDPPGAWQQSRNPTDSHQGASLIAQPDARTKTVTYNATVPEDGDYEIFLWWVASNSDFRSSKVPVTVSASTGTQRVTVDQTSGNKQWNSIGTFPLKAGQNVPVVTISTEGVEAGPTINVSADAVKLVKVR